MTDKDAIFQDVQQLGITRPGQIYANLSATRLVEAALARGEGVLAANGALVALTGKRTGRSPGDKFVVRYEGSPSAEQVEWGKVNQPMAPEVFERLRARILAH